MIHLHIFMGLPFMCLGIDEILLAVAAIAATAGTVTSIASASNKPASPSVTAPTPPNSADAQAAAESAQQQERKTFLAAGGQTDYTGGLGVLTGTDVSRATLVGS